MSGMRSVQYGIMVDKAKGTTVNCTVIARKLRNKTSGDIQDSEPCPENSELHIGRSG